MPGQVTVAAKLPHGLVMRIFEMVETQEPVMGGGFRAIKVARERPERVTLNGFAHAQNKAPNAPQIEGFAMTHSVDKDFWDAWLAQNNTSDIVKNGLIFAHEKTGNTEANAKNNKDVRSGLERLEPTKLPRGLETRNSATV